MSYKKINENKLKLNEWKNRREIKTWKNKKEKKNCYLSVFLELYRLYSHNSRATPHTQHTFQTRMQPLNPGPKKKPSSSTDDPKPTNLSKESKASVLVQEPSCCGTANKLPCTLVITVGILDRDPPKDMGPPKMVSGTHTIPMFESLKIWEWYGSRFP